MQPVRWCKSDAYGLYKDTSCFTVKGNALWKEGKDRGSKFTEELAVNQERLKSLLRESFFNTAMATYWGTQGEGEG